MKSQRPRLLLLTPPYHSGVVESAGVWMPLSVVCLAGHARRAGAEVMIYDAMSRFATHEDIAKVIEDFRPQMVGVTAITAMEPDAREVCRAAKRVDPNIVTIIGGVHPSFCWEQLLTDEPAIDVVVRGEGEETVAELVQAVAASADFEKIAGVAYRKDGKAQTNAPRPFFENIDHVERAWDLVDWEKYYYRPHPEGRMAIIDTSRGCQHHCSFCSQHKLWLRTWRARSPESLVDEMALLRERYDARVILFSDEMPTVNAERWERILDLLIERDLDLKIMMETRADDVVRDERIMEKYLAAGMSHVYIGVEAGDQAKLDLFEKGTKAEQGRQAIELVNDYDMITETSFILGTLDETPDSINDTLEIAKAYAPDMAFFLALTPWPYADIYSDFKDHIAVTDLRKYNLVEPVVKPHAMTIDQMRVALHRATGHFFKDKFERLDTLSEDKRTFMVRVLKLLIEHSYLGSEMHHMASDEEMPESVKKMLETLGDVDVGKLTA